MTEPHFSKAADNNKDVIFEQLRVNLRSGDRVLEIASGTAQHALHFTAQMPELIWQASDLDLDQYGLRDRIAANARENLKSPIQLDIERWPGFSDKFDAVYSANCLHIIDASLMKPYVTGAAASLKAGGKMLLYGPFKYDGAFTTASNAQFDEFLRQTYPGGGIRDFEEVDRLAAENGLIFQSDTKMPANNQFLVWHRA